MAKRVSPTGAELFIVDNSHPEAKVDWYLREWCQLSEKIDIATGFFEIGGLLAMKEAWQQVGHIRILMGDDISKRTRTTMLQGIQQQLDRSLESEKDLNDFLEGVPALVEAIRTGQIECRIYRREKFHAKAYITHARSAVIGSTALVGSSNLTLPGLTQNIELNVKLEGPQVNVLQEWYEEHWKQGEDVREEMLQTLERHTKEYAPFLIYIRALQEYFRGHRLSVNEWERKRSKMYARLSKYQQDGYGSLVKIAQQYGGALLCDGVGLGKTFIGLMLIERLIMHEGKRVVLFAPKAALEGVWKPHILKYLPDVGGVGERRDYSQLSVFAHTDFSRRDHEFQARLNYVSKMADAVIIDEAHQFRNPGQRADADRNRSASRYYKLYDFLGGSEDAKQLYLLTATPINNSLLDFRNLVQLFTRDDEAYFGQTLGVHNLRAHFAQLARKLEETLQIDPDNIGENLQAAEDLLAGSPTFKALVVQRSRAFVRESQQLEAPDEKALFPEKASPKVAKYSIRATYGELLHDFAEACSGNPALFTLPFYTPLDYYTGNWADLLPEMRVPEPSERMSAAQRQTRAIAFAKNRGKQIVNMIRTSFLKRFESSVRAFEVTSNRLALRLLAFLEKHSDTAAEKEKLAAWQLENYSVFDVAAARQQELFETPKEDEEDEDPVTEEILRSVDLLDRASYDIPRMLKHTYDDLDTLLGFLRRMHDFKPANDDKLKQLIEILRSPNVRDEKMLIFTEFADTATYLYTQLKAAGIPGLFVLHGSSNVNRADVIRRFSPYYNGSSSAKLAEAKLEEIQVLISTDVLSEGLNLQDATRMINYDIHWNPVRLMQRIGRVDRRINYEIEEQLVADHPHLKNSRGKVEYWNFLPPEELNEVLSLYNRVTHKTLVISKTFGIEGKQLLTPDDDYDPTREFNHEYEGEKTSDELMKLELQKLFAADPTLENTVSMLPGAVFSGRKRVADSAQAVFFCYAIPGFDRVLKEYTLDAGTTHWLLYELETEQILTEPNRILEAIRCVPETPRQTIMERPTLAELRRKVESLLRNSHLKKLNAPLTVKPILRCWMELS